MIIGTFKYDSAKDTYTGEISTLTLFRIAVALTPTQAASDREPNYRIVAEGERGPVEYGAAWKRTTESGKPFVSLLLDDPSFAAPCNAALFLHDHEDVATLFWTRAKAKSPKPEPERPAPPPRRKPRLRAVQPS